jgi:hypothetical protein
LLSPDAVVATTSPLVGLMFPDRRLALFPASSRPQGNGNFRRVDEVVFVTPPAAQPIHANDLRHLLPTVSEWTEHVSSTVPTVRIWVGR